MILCQFSPFGESSTKQQTKQSPSPSQCPPCVFLAVWFINSSDSSCRFGIVRNTCIASFLRALPLSVDASSWAIGHGHDVCTRRTTTTGYSLNCPDNISVFARIINLKSWCLHIFLIGNSFTHNTGHYLRIEISMGQLWSSSRWRMVGYYSLSKLTVFECLAFCTLRGTDRYTDAGKFLEAHVPSVRAFGLSQATE
jgi:hypothetical protein